MHAQLAEKLKQTAIEFVQHWFVEPSSAGALLAELDMSAFMMKHQCSDKDYYDTLLFIQAILEFNHPDRYISNTHLWGHVRRVTENPQWVTLHKFIQSTIGTSDSTTNLSGASSRRTNTSQLTILQRLLLAVGVLGVTAQTDVLDNIDQVNIALADDSSTNPIQIALLENCNLMIERALLPNNDNQYENALTYLTSHCSTEQSDFNDLLYRLSYENAIRLIEFFPPEIIDEPGKRSAKTLLDYAVNKQDEESILIILKHISPNARHDDIAIYLMAYHDIPLRDMKLGELITFVNAIALDDYSYSIDQYKKDAQIAIFKKVENPDNFLAVLKAYGINKDRHTKRVYIPDYLGKHIENIALHFVGEMVLDYEKCRKFVDETLSFIETRNTQLHAELQVRLYLASYRFYAAKNCEMIDDNLVTELWYKIMYKQMRIQGFNPKLHERHNESILSDGATGVGIEALSPKKLNTIISNYIRNPSLAKSDDIFYHPVIERKGLSFEQQINMEKIAIVYLIEDIFDYYRSDSLDYAKTKAAITTVINFMQDKASNKSVRNSLNHLLNIADEFTFYDNYYFGLWADSVLAKIYISENDYSSAFKIYEDLMSKGFYNSALMRVDALETMNKFLKEANLRNSAVIMLYCNLSIITIIDDTDIKQHVADKLFSSIESSMEIIKSSPHETLSLYDSCRLYLITVELRPVFEEMGIETDRRFKKLSDDIEYEFFSSYFPRSLWNSLVNNMEWLIHLVGIIITIIKSRKNQALPLDDDENYQQLLNNSYEIAYEKLISHSDQFNEDHLDNIIFERNEALVWIIQHAINGMQGNKSKKIKKLLKEDLSHDVLEQYKERYLNFRERLYSIPADELTTKILQNLDEFITSSALNIHTVDYNDLKININKIIDSWQATKSANDTSIEPKTLINPLVEIHESPVTKHSVGELTVLLDQPVFPEQSTLTAYLNINSVSSKKQKLFNNLKSAINTLQQNRKEYSVLQEELSHLDERDGIDEMLFNEFASRIAKINDTCKTSIQRYNRQAEKFGPPRAVLDNQPKAVQRAAEIVALPPKLQPKAPKQVPVRFPQKARVPQAKRNQPPKAPQKNIQIANKLAKVTPKAHTHYNLDNVAAMQDIKDFDGIENLILLIQNQIIFLQAILDDVLTNKASLLNSALAATENLDLTKAIRHDALMNCCLRLFSHIIDICKTKHLFLGTTFKAEETIKQLELIREIFAHQTHRTSTDFMCDDLMKHLNGIIDSYTIVANSLSKNMFNIAHYNQLNEFLELLSSKILKSDVPLRSSFNLASRYDQVALKLLGKSDHYNTMTITEADDRSCALFYCAYRGRVVAIVEHAKSIYKHQMKPEYLQRLINQRNEEAHENYVISRNQLMANDHDMIALKDDQIIMKSSPHIFRESKVKPKLDPNAPEFKPRPHVQI